MSGFDRGYRPWQLELQGKPTGLWTPNQRLLDGAEAAERFARYEHAHAKPAARLLKSMGNAYDGTDRDRLRMIADMPMVAFGPALESGANHS